jgi:parallel beta-helix repeat protein
MLNCTIDRCEYGIYVSKSDCEVRNTNITNCTYYGVHGLITLFDYNNVWNNGVNLESGTLPGLHDISVDPLYVNPTAGDYRLSTGSPCIETGDPNPFLVDPDGTRGDIGYSYYQGPTDVDDESGLPSDFALAQNYPNPFNPSTRIAFTLPHRTDTKLEVFSVLGTRVRVLLNQPLSGGDHVAEWDGLADDGTRAATGVYFYRLQADDVIATRKMVLLK